MERFAAALILRASPYSFPPGPPCAGSNSGDDFIRLFGSTSASAIKNHGLRETGCRSEFCVRK